MEINIPIRIQGEVYTSKTVYINSAKILNSKINPYITLKRELERLAYPSELVVDKDDIKSILNKIQLI